MDRIINAILCSTLSLCHLTGGIEAAKTSETQYTVEDFNDYSPQEFIEVYQTANLPDTASYDPLPSITGDKAADEHIRSLAEAKGYRIQPQATGELAEMEDELVQPGLASAWMGLKQEAAEAGYTLSLFSGHRTAEYQQELFMERLKLEVLRVTGLGVNPEEIASGEWDLMINAILTHTSIPGYSKHHTGYAIDIHDFTTGRPYNEFGHTDAFRWLSYNNYFHAKKHGFTPSYPIGADDSGPAPEAWEFVWVGADNLLR